jgi:hypothetical protein
MRCKSFLIAATLSLGFSTAAHAVPLSTLIPGSTLVQGDATFENFFFEDLVPDPLPGDQAVSAGEIDIKTSATANTVSLTATINPAISISGTNTGSDGAPEIVESIFAFFLDFDISISGYSARQITGVSLVGDVSAEGDALSRVVYDLGTSTVTNPDLEIFEDGLFPPPQLSDSITFSARNFVFFEGQIGGLTFDGGTAGLLTFTLTFDLQDPAVIPLPAGLPLLLAGLGSLALFRRRKS